LAALGRIIEVMRKILPIAQIRSKYRNQWVLVENPKLDKDLEVISGHVIWHSKDRDEVYDKALELQPRHPAILYTGKLPKDMVIIL
jgi:hypothetical protein